MAAVAIKGALEDAGVTGEAIEQCFASYCYGDSTCGQRAIYEAGIYGVPIVNVNNNCSSGSSALYLARQAVRGGTAACALAVGFEKMERGSLKSHWDDRENPMGKVC
jgi:sterol carrier protein 2